MKKPKAENATERGELPQLVHHIFLLPFLRIKKRKNGREESKRRALAFHDFTLLENQNFLSLRAKCKDLVDVTFHFDLRKDLRDFSIGTDDESGPLNPHEFAAIKGLFFPDAVSLAKFAFSVGEERKWQRVFRLELLMAGNRILAYAEHYHVFALQSRK